VGSASTTICKQKCWFPIQNGARRRKTVDQIKERFYYAGGSARYYWRFSDVSQLIQFLSDQITRYYRVRRIAGRIGSDSFELTSHVDSCEIFVSEYVTRCLSNHFTKSTLSAFQHQLLPNNPAWQEWVIKTEFLYYCHLVQTSNDSTAKLELRNHSMRSFKCKISKIIRFEYLNDICPATVEGKDSADEVLFVPMMWCNSAYDAISIKYRQTLSGIKPIATVFHVTLALQPTKKLQYI
jgi:hypothetical protein